MIDTLTELLDVFLVPLVAPDHGPGDRGKGATGYKDFDWNDQTILALATAVTWNERTFNLGVNYGKTRY